jgi:hypothetical protein
MAGQSLGGWQYEQHGRENDAKDQVYITYNKLFGRDPTAAEVAQAMPFYGTDPHITDNNNGNAYIANLYQQQQNTPDKLMQKQQEDALTKAPQYYDQINQLFKSSLNRDATDAEKQHFGSLMATGQADQYGVSQLLQGTSEYQQGQNKNFQDQLRGQLSSADSEYFNKYLSPQIQSQFANAGRRLDQPALANAFAQAGQQQNLQREQWLGQVSANQYNNSSQNAYGDYQNYVNQLYGRQNQQIGTQLGYAQQNQQRQYDVADYQYQQDAYNRYLQQYGKRNTGLGGLIGGALGAGLGGYFGGAQGANAGYGIGSGLGNAGQSAFGGY